MKKNEATPVRRTRTSGAFLLCLAGGLLVFVVFSHYFPVLPRTADIAGRVVIAIALLGAALYAQRTERFSRHWPILLAFFIALAAISVDYFSDLSKWILPALKVSGDSPAGWAVDKLESSLLSIAVVILLTRLSGAGLRTLYLRRGRLGLGLIVGFTAFAVMIASVIPVSKAFFGGENLSWVRILPWTPWVLIFVLANAFNEELLFRGLFFGKMEPYLGKIGTNLVMTVPFVLMHSGVSYTPDALIFAGILIPLSLAWGYVLQKTDSLWGSFLFHAAMDIPIVVGIFSTLP